MERSGLTALQEWPHFAGLSSETVERLRRTAMLEFVPARVMLLQQGRVPESLYFLIDGLVQLFTPGDGPEATILILKPPACFIAAPVLRNEALPTSARTIQPSQVLTIDAAEARRLIETDHGFARLIMNDLALACSGIMQELKSLRTQTAFQRLIAWVLGMHGQVETESGIELPYDKYLLAARLGMAPETLSRNLAQLAKLGVAVHGRTLSIENADNLRRLVKIDEANALSVP